MKFKSSRPKSPNPTPVIEIMTKALDELNHGYNPPFCLVIYPYADGENIGSALGFTADDPESATQFNNIIEEMLNTFKKAYILDSLGLELADLEKAAEMFSSDVKKASERASDMLRKDAPIRSTKEAEALLAKIIAGKK